jgi:hypothetical protein
MTPGEENAKELLKELLVDALEMVDDKIGGPVMDLPIVDEIEKNIVHVVVDVLWSLATKETDVHDVLPWSA